MKITRLAFIVLLTFFLIGFTFAQSSDTLLIYYSIDSIGVEWEFQNDIRNYLKKDVQEIKINSYTDFLGTFAHNQQLSQKRANLVKKYILSQDVPASAITECKGNGVHQFSSYENRRNPDDRGILQHRVSKVVFIYKEEPEVKEIVEEEIVVEEDTVEEVVIPIFANLTEENLIVGENIVLENIIFEGGTPYFKPESENALRQLYLAMKNNPTLVIEIQGHICCQDDGLDGWDRVNQNNFLSVNRAEAVYDYLIKYGIEAERMSYVGFGSSNKLYPEERNAFEENHNRRVEILIIEK